MFARACASPTGLLLMDQVRLTVMRRDTPGRVLVGVTAHAGVS